MMNEDFLVMCEKTKVSIAIALEEKYSAHK